MSKRYGDEIAMVYHDMMKAARSVDASGDAKLRKFEKYCFVKDRGAKQTSPAAGRPGSLSPLPV